MTVQKYTGPRRHLRVNIVPFTYSLEVSTRSYPSLSYLPATRRSLASQDHPRTFYFNNLLPLASAIKTLLAIRCSPILSKWPKSSQHLWSTLLDKSFNSTCSMHLFIPNHIHSCHSCKTSQTHFTDRGHNAILSTSLLPQLHFNCFHVAHLLPYEVKGQYSMTRWASGNELKCSCNNKVAHKIAVVPSH